MALAGKTAVIIGGAGGIGFATAHHYLNEGIKNLAILDVCDGSEKLAQLKEQFNEANIIFLATDITKRDMIERSFQTILDEFKQIDVVVNGAGLIREKEIELVVATNLVGLINASLVAMDAMSKANGGSGGIIVNIASVAGLEPIPGTPIYSATKHGVIGFTRSMAHDCYFAKHGVKFVVICPGLTETPLAAAFGQNLLSDEAKDVMREVFNTIPHQSADECGKIISKITPTAANGTIWIVDGGEYEEITIPKLYNF